MAEQEQLHASGLRRLSGLLAQQTGEFLLVGVDGVGELQQQRGAVVLGAVAPRREGGPGCGHGAVDVGLRGDGDRGEGLPRAGVRRPAGHGRVGELVVDHIVKGLEPVSAHRIGQERYDGGKRTSKSARV